MSLIRMGEDLFATIEKRMHYRWWWKERERSNHAVQIGAGEWRPSCPTRHSHIAWFGPPHDAVQGITCIDCGAFVTEPEMKDMGFNFNDCPDWIYLSILDKKRQLRFEKGDPKVFYPSK